MKNFKFVIWLVFVLGFNAALGMQNEVLQDSRELEWDLWYAIFSIQLAPIVSCYKVDDSIKKIEELLRQNVNPNSRNFVNSAQGTVPLIYAVSMLDIDLVKLFLKYKARINLVDPFIRVTAIHKVLDYLESKTPTVEDTDYMKGLAIFNILMVNQADLEISNLKGETADLRCKNLF